MVYHVVIGDVHGCHETLLRLLHEIERFVGTTPYQLYFVGDLVDRGPHSDRVCNVVMASGARSVLGGHEEKMLRFWRRTGQKARPPRRTRKQLDHPKYREHLESLPLTVEFSADGQRYVVVHAGVMPGVPRHLQKPEHLLRLRRLKEGEVSRNVPGAVGWWELWQGPEHIVFGHVNFNNGPCLAPFATGIDTGCCYGYRLSCVVFPGRTILSVPSEIARPSR